MEGAHDRARHDVQSEPLGKERGDLATRQAQLRVEHRRRGDGVGTDLHGRRAEGVGGLPRMAALHAPAAAAHWDIEAPDQRPHGRQVFLILGRHVRVLDGAAGGTRARQGHVVRFVDHGRNAPTPLSPVRRSRLSSGAPRIRRGRPFRERCGLADAGAPCGVELLAQPLVVASQALAVALEPRQLRAQSSDFFCVFGRIVGGFRFWPGGHATVMPELPIQYKSNRARTLTNYKPR